MSEEKFSYPCISEKAWWTLRNQFKKTIPAEITDVFIQTLLGMQSKSSARNNILVPLRQINFIDGEGKPTDLLYDFRLDDKYNGVCSKILKDVYPSELLDLFPDQEVDKIKVANYFMSKTKAGSAQTRKLAAFFTLLKSGKIGETGTQNKKSKKASPKKQESNGSITQHNQATSQENAGELTSPTIEKNKKNMSIHIDLQIHISPDADAEQIDHIFESMSKYLYKD